jgi:hypothetical protein
VNEDGIYWSNVPPCSLLADGDDADDEKLEELLFLKKG